MAIVTIGVATRAETERRFIAAYKGNVSAQDPRIDFVSFDVLHRVLAPNRWRILQAMTGQGPLTMREVARRVDRDFKGVHTDIHALIDAGLLDRQIIGTESGVLFRHDGVRLDVTMAAA